MKNTTHRSPRHRNPHKGDKQDQPFFNKASDQAIQTKEEQSFFQTKLTVGQPGDAYEKEADAMADAVTNNSSKTPDIQNKEISQIQRYMTNANEDELGTNTQRIEKDKMIQEKSDSNEAPVSEEEEPVQAMHEEKEQPVQQMEEDTENQPEEVMQPMQEEEQEPIQAKNEEEEPVQAKKSGTHSKQPGSRMARTLEGTKGSGRPLPKSTKGEMESAFGANFSKVRVHTSQDSVSMNKELKAQAFTHGQDIYFNTGKYRPETSSGKHLLAHELTHVVQQSGKGKKVQKQDGSGRAKISAPAGKIKRKDFVFVMGDTSDDDFYKFAGKYFKATYPTATYFDSIRTLEDILVSLKQNIKSGERLGNLYVVTHGATDGTLSFGLNNGDTDSSIDYEELSEAVKKKKLTDLSKQVDNQSRIYIKGCNIGQSGDMVQLIDQSFSGNGKVIATTHEMQYTQSSGKLYESLVGPNFERPGKKKFSRTELTVLVKNRYGHLSKTQQSKLVRELYKEQYVDSEPIVLEGPIKVYMNNKEALQLFANDAKSKGLTLKKLKSSRPKRQGNEFFYEFEVTDTAGNKNTTKTSIAFMSQQQALQAAKKGEPDIHRFNWRYKSRLDKSGMYSTVVYKEMVYAEVSEYSLDRSNKNRFNPPSSNKEFYKISN